MELLFSENLSALFVFALLYAAIAGMNLTIKLRVAFIYDVSLLVFMFSSISKFSIIIGTLLVLFLLLEVFNQDEYLVKMFSIKYKFIDFIFKMIAEYYGLQFFLVMIILFYLEKTKLSTEIVDTIGVISILFITLLLIRGKFSTESVTTIINRLTCKSSVNEYIQYKENRIKYEILVAMEDRTFYERKENQHGWTIKRASRYLRKGLDKIKHYKVNKTQYSVKEVKTILQRGYGTIEMQLIRTIGIAFGSYSCRVRRKIYELIYSNMIFNSYIQNYGQDSPVRKHVKEWIIQNYINNVSVKFGERAYYPKDKSTIEELFKKDFCNISKEEFFVWCLGLPYYRNGVGYKAVKIHENIILDFRLNKDEIMKIIESINGNNS